MTDTAQDTADTAPILIIEDDAGFAELMETTLVEEGYGCRCVANGSEALDWLADNSPMMIILDYALPDMTGSLFIEQMRDLGKAFWTATTSSFFPAR